MDELKIPDTFAKSPYASEQFTRIVKWARQNNPYYQQQQAAHGTQVPILSRTDILDNNELLLNGHPVTGKTTGSTGVPVEISWSDERKKLEQQVTNKFIAWLGGTLPGTRIIHLFPEHVGDEFLDVNESVAVQIKTILRRYKSDVAVSITTYPTNVERLCRVIIEQGLDMGFIQRVGCYAEVFETYHEDLINQAFPNATVWTTYSASEVGMIAARCPHNPEYHHVFAGKLGIEVLDDEDEPCKNGELGRLVITDYFNAQVPFIRYEIGDLVARGDCPCGKIPLPAFTQVVGKVRGALVHRNGERVPFTQLSYALREIPGVRQYQVIQHQLDLFELRYVIKSYQYGEDEFFAAVKLVFEAHFGYLPAINFTREEHIKRGKNGKFYASISHV